MVKYVCQDCNKLLSEEETIIDVDGPMCKDCYKEYYPSEDDENLENAIPLEIEGNKPLSPKQLG